MELQVYVIIVVVFLASFFSLLFINKQLRGGKTFEEVLAEKRLLTERLYGPTKKKGVKKANVGKKNKDRKSAKQQKPKPEIIESDNKSESGSEYDTNGNTSPVPSSPEEPKLHVEFTEEEYIAADSNTVAFTRQLSGGKLHVQPSVRKVSNTKPPGTSILVNKTTVKSQVLTTNLVSVDTEQLNHFDKIHPKDDLEVKRHREESVGRTTPNSSSNKKENKKGGGKQHKKEKENSPVVSTEKQFTAIVESQLIVPNEVITVTSVMASNVASAPQQKESPKHLANKEKQNKKKKSDAILIQQLVDAGVASATSDAVNVSAIISQLGRTELTRGEIQLLIDFLLNKQQDTADVTHSDWSDDIVHKLRRQIEDKDRLLGEEQKAALALQTKLREMRVEWNNERAQSHHKINAQVEEINLLKNDLNQLQQEIQLTTERHATENKALNTQLQHLQQKLYQEKNAQSQENAQKLQQLTDTNAKYAAEILNKNNVIQDMQEKFLQIRDESLKKLADYEKKFQEYVRNSEADVARLTADVQHLRAECQRKEEYEKLFAIQKYDLEKLEARMAEQSKTNSQLDDNSKVEIRNLQNALDSTKTELTLSRNDLAESTKRVNELNAKMVELQNAVEVTSAAAAQQHAQELDELNSSVQQYKTAINEKDAKLAEYQTKLENLSTEQREQELFKQIADYKEKNNELRKKNWKLVDALQKAEESAFKITSKCKLVTPNTSLTSPIAVTNNSAEQQSQQHQSEQIAHTRELFAHLFPNIPSINDKQVDYNVWLSNLQKHLEQQQQQLNNNNNSKLSNSKVSNGDYQHDITDNNGSRSVNNGNDDDDDDDDDDNDDAADDNVDDNDDSTQNAVAAATEELVLQNAKLKSTVDEYKLIVAETETVLTNLEKKVKEQDAYWRNIVETKENQLKNLQQISNSATT